MATTAEMLSDPAYIRQLKAIADQNAWNSMLKTCAEIANQNSWTGLGQLLGTAIGLKWGRNEGEADYQRSINAFQEKKFQDAFNKNSSWINNATSAVSQLSQPQTSTNSQPINSWLFNPREVQNKFAQDTGNFLTPSINDSLYQKMKNPYGLQTNYFPYNPAQTPPTNGNPSLNFSQPLTERNFPEVPYPFYKGR